MRDFPLFPDQASTVAADVDALFFFLIAVSTFFGLLIAALLVTFTVRFRRRHADQQGERHPSPLWLELTWSLIPLGIVMVVFVWSARLFFDIHRVPSDAVDVQIVGKRWMWKIQHVTGQREINQLHVPVGVPVRLTLTSEDVIHSFFIPAFRIKKDAVPGRYTTTWFEATEPGTYHLFCAEYCGTKHSEMIGQIVVMEPAAFQAWLAGGAEGVSLADAGERLFEQLACVTCHRADSEGRGPSLEGVFGSEVELANGERVVADAEYVRESIVAPSARITAGYQPVMPTYQGLVSEEGLLQLIAYIQTLGGEEAEAVPAAAGGGAAPATGAATAPASSETEGSTP
jgi:cytochrome c oxidase subunit 2